MPLDLTHIPKIMRKQRWYKAASLMDEWFGRPAATAPQYGAPDTTTIRMDQWALHFPRAQKGI
jgi:hypothetical protein